MKDQELFFTLNLLSTEGVGEVIARRLLVHFGTAEQIFKATKNDLIQVQGVRDSLWDKLKNDTSKSFADRELNYIKKNNVSYTYFRDTDYPNKLLSCSDAPILLFKKGNINLQSKRLLSVVGCRNPSKYALNYIRELIEEISHFNPIIVSGMAYGCDITAHLLATEFGLQTIGLLAHGLNQMYPKAHESYIDKICEHGGFMTEFWSNSYPDKDNFLKRNRIIAGMSEATVIIESTLSGGALKTAVLAARYNRLVFALPGRVSDVYSQGGNYLIHNKTASILTKTNDIVQALQWGSAQEAVVGVQKKLFENLDDDQQAIFDYLHFQGKSFLDLISFHTQIPVQKTASILLQLEIKGMVTVSPGNYYEVL
ncbi:MAG: DNA-protecting protein DprA [Flavobacterium sp.]|nr:DNA-protecting protein DprA [Candidatus Neoflavobacterium equi]